MLCLVIDISNDNILWYSYCFLCVLRVLRKGGEYSAHIFNGILYFIILQKSKDEMFINIYKHKETRFTIFYMLHNWVVYIFLNCVIFCYKYDSNKHYWRPIGLQVNSWLVFYLNFRRMWFLRIVNYTMI